MAMASTLPTSMAVSSVRRSPVVRTSGRTVVRSAPLRLSRGVPARRVAMRATEGGEMDSYTRIEAPVRGGEGRPGRIPDGGPPVADRKDSLDDFLIQNDAVEEKKFLGTVVAFPDALRFKGAAPEVINSRLAMLGFVLAVIGEKTTGLPVWEQVKMAPGPVAATFAVFIVASLIPILKGVPRKGGSEWALGLPIFTPDAELINGRVAMLGFVGLLIGEYVTRM